MPRVCPGSVGPLLLQLELGDDLGDMELGTLSLIQIAREAAEKPLNGE